MGRLIDADELKDHLFVGADYDKAINDGISKTDEEVFAFRCGWNDALKSVVQFAPTVDAIEVVRCKDCQYSRPKKSGIKLHCAWWYRGVYEDDFCSSGKRRKDGT